jgi:mannan endo-1,6-alpha-mannosidase
LWDVEYIDHETWSVYDGGHVKHNCTDINKAQFSYNVAILLQGSAYMYNYVSSPLCTTDMIPPSATLANTPCPQTNGEAIWRMRIENLLRSVLRDFFPNNTAYEVPCEGRQGACSTDMLSFKGYVHRWLSVVTQIAPFTADTILPVLRTSTQAAVNQCTGGPTGRRCGFYWSTGQYVDPAVDGTTGAGEQMSVLAAVSSLLIGEAAPPTTNQTGGTSKGDYGAGSSFASVVQELRPIGPGDRAGAAIITVLILAGALGMFGWMSWELGG